MKKFIKIFIALILFSICSVSYFERFNPLKDFSLFIVESNSMSPSIKKGHLLFSSKNTSYGIGDVITFSYPYDINKLISHRITEFVSEEGPNGINVYFKTKGDANISEDPWRIKESSVKGKVFFSIPLFGYLIFFIRNPIGYLLIISGFAILMISESNDVFLETLSLYRSFYRYFGVKIIKFKTWRREFNRRLFENEVEKY